MIFEVITQYGSEHITHCSTEDEAAADRLFNAIKKYYQENSPQMVEYLSISILSIDPSDSIVWTHRAFWTFDMPLTYEVEEMIPTFDHEYADRFLPENNEVKAMPEWLCVYGTSAQDAIDRTKALVKRYKELYEPEER